MKKLGTLLRRWWLHWSDPVVLGQSIVTATVVGTVLLFITLGGRLVRGEFGTVILLKTGLTYLVPFLVSSFTAVKTQLRVQPGQQAPRRGTYRCERCLKSGHVHDETMDADSILRECPRFGSDTDYVFYDQRRSDSS